MAFYRYLSNKIVSVALPLIRADFDAAKTYSAQLSAWQADEIAAMQLSKIAAVWSDCVTDIPYYQKLVQSEQAPATIHSWNDFHKLPILDKTTFRRNQADFIRRSGPPHHYMQTAGSTGNPIRFGVWKHESKPIRIAKQVSWIRNGYGVGSPIFLLWGHSHLLGTGVKRLLKHAVRKSKDALLNYHRDRADAMSPEDCERIAQRILKCRPIGIIGYASALDLLARYGTSHRTAMRGAGVRFVLSTAELPPRPDTFDAIRDTFDCAVIQEYGGVDFGHVAMKQENAAWQVFPDLNVIQTTDEQEELGNPVLVTTLYRRYTPFIRYKQGDLIDGARRLPHGHIHSFDRLVGRSHDMFTMEDGTQVHSVSIFHCVHFEPKILNIQMSLTDSGPRLRLIVLDGPDNEVEKRIRHRLGQIHPALHSAPIEYVPDLITNVGGKRRWFVDERTNKNGSKF